MCAILIMSKIKGNSRYCILSCLVAFLVLIMSNWVHMNQEALRLQATLHNDGHDMTYMSTGSASSMETASSVVASPVVLGSTPPPTLPLEFVHIPYTGGAAIEYAGSLANITWGLCHWTVRQWAGPGCQKPDQNVSQYDDANMAFALLHLPPHWLQKGLVDVSYQTNSSLFTVVRNPYDRFINEFYGPDAGLFSMKWLDENKSILLDENDMDQTLAEKISDGKVETPLRLNEFLLNRLGRIRHISTSTAALVIPQSIYTFGTGGKPLVNHVLHYENLDEDLSNLMKHYRLPVNLEKQSISRIKSRMTIKDLSPETIGRINQVARDDFLNFGYEMLDPKVVAAQRTRERTVHRIYYINLSKNTERRQLMENWLSRQPIPYERISASMGRIHHPEDCVLEKQFPEQCRGISGLAKTQLDIIRNHNTSGLTLVFEDDFVAKEPLDKLVKRTLKLVPDGWDVIRWDCWGDAPGSFPRITPATVFRTTHERPCNAMNEPCEFYGGTHAMMWNQESVSKLERVWSQTPYDDIDARLVTDQLNSYCVNLGIGYIDSPLAESTDIPKQQHWAGNKKL